jgi:DNA-binding HxlR family transcriptional regulator
MREAKLSDEVKEEMKKLREEIAKLKEQLGSMTEEEKQKRHGIYIDIGNRVHDYMGDIMESVAEGIEGELDKSVFVGPHGVRIIRSRNGCHTHCISPKMHRHGEEHEEPEPNLQKMAETMSALGEEHRLGILKELMNGGKYINELQEKLPEITASTLSSHLDVLQEAGLVVQEKVRGRYLVTMPGRAAYKMATRITRFTERGVDE